MGKQRKQSRGINKPTVLYVLFVVLWAPLSLIASQYLTAFLLSLVTGEHLNQPFWVLIYYIISYSCALALILLLPSRLYRLYQKQHAKKTSAESSATFSITRSELGVANSPTLVDLGLAPVAYIVYAIFANILTTIFSAFSWFDAGQSQDVGFGYFLTTADRLYAIFAVVLIAPIAEEIMMRGWLYGKLRERTSLIVAIVITSLLFAVLHGQWNVAVATFVLSAILCSLREITGTIWSGIFLHILVNGIAFYLLYIAQIV